MKQKIFNLLISLKEAIRRGILWIFPKPLLQIFMMIFVWMSSIYDAILQKLSSQKAKYLSAFSLGCLFLILIGCSTQRQVVTQLVHDVRTDTVYLSNMQYDSIYIYQESNKDYHLNPSNLSNPSNSDTLFIKDVSIEYRYKLLRDTVRVIQRDSIPYQVTVVKTKEITRPKTTFDIISYWCFGIVVGLILFLIYRIIRKFIIL